MEHIHNNLMKLGGSLGNVSQKLKKLVIKTPKFNNFCEALPSDPPKTVVL
jgi:hypothetical protein